MTVEKLIELLMTLPMDMPVGETNYYGDFGPVTGIDVEIASNTGGGDESYVGRKVAVINAAVDVQ